MAKWVNLDDCIEISIGDMNFYPVELLGDVYEDVAPVIHARFIFDKTNLRFLCTNCETEPPSFYTAETVKTFNYCPYCGAKMDKGG